MSGTEIRRPHPSRFKTETIMRNSFFYDSPILPSGFNFPKSYLELVQSHTIPDLNPWKFFFLNMPGLLSYYIAKTLRATNHELVHHQKIPTAKKMRINPASRNPSADGCVRAI